MPPATRTRLDASGERNVGGLMAVAGLALCLVALLFDARPGSSTSSPWKVGLSGFALLTAGLVKLRVSVRQLRDLSSPPPPITRRRSRR